MQSETEGTTVNLSEGPRYEDLLLRTRCVIVPRSEDDVRKVGHGRARCLATRNVFDYEQQLPDDLFCIAIPQKTSI